MLISLQNYFRSKPARPYLTATMLQTVSLSDFDVEHRFAPRQYMQPGELDILVALISSVSPRSVLEIGVNIGMTAHVVLDYVPSIEHYQGVDLLPEGLPTLQGQYTEVPAKPGHLVSDRRFELILRLHGSFDLQPKDLLSADAIFIDGDHSYDAVLNDSYLAKDLIRDGGIIIWHDYGNPTVEVTAALDDLAANGRNIRHIDGTWLAFERF